MASSDAAIESHELVYGSAPRLLQAGGTDLGVIASTRNFPASASRKLERHRDYTAYAPAATRAKYIIGWMSGHVELTRIEMGTDHTGRRIPFSRHLLLPLAASDSCGDLVRRAAAHAADPRLAAVGWIEPQPRLAPLPPAATPSPALAKAVAAAAETVIRYQETKRPVVLVQSASTPASGADLDFIAIVGDVLPRGTLPSWVAATHVIEDGDRLPEGCIHGTYSGSPFHTAIMARSGARKPLVIDIESLAVDGNSEPPSAFVRATIADLAANCPGHFARLCDRLQAKPEHHGRVAEISDALRRMETISRLDSVEGFVAIVRKAGAVLDRDSLSRLAIEKISAAVQSPSSDLIKDAASLADGVPRLSSLLEIDESLQECATRVAISRMNQGGGKLSQTLAAALREAGEDAIAVASRVASGNSGRAFLDLLAPPRAEPSVIEPGATVRGTTATVMPKPQRRVASPPSVGTTNRHPMRRSMARGLDGSAGPPLSFGSERLWRATAVFSLLFAFLGVCRPVWRKYEHPKWTSEAGVADISSRAMSGSPTVSKKPNKQSKDAGSSNAKAPNSDACTTPGVFSASRMLAHVKDCAGAVWKAIGKSQSRLYLPGFFAVLTLGFYFLNGVLTQASVGLLPRFQAAWYLPTVLMLLSSIVAVVLGSR